MARRIGVVAVQGDFAKHLEALRNLNLTDVTPVEVRTPEDLEGVERLIIPGGESTTVGLLLERYGLGDAIIARAQQGMPVWGTCMGMILMAREVAGRKQYTLNLLNVEIERNAFGAQVHSFEDEVEVVGLERPVTGVFIRAPVVSSAGEDVEVLARYEGRVVAVRQGKRLGTSFHPELTDDLSLHEWFLRL